MMQMFLYILVLAIVFIIGYTVGSYDDSQG